MVTMTDITGFQIARRKAEEKELLKKLKADKDALNTDVEDVEDVQEGNELSIEEVKEKLVELGVSFHPNAKLSTLLEKLKAAEDNG